MRKLSLLVLLIFFGCILFGCIAIPTHDIIYEKKSYWDDEKLQSAINEILIVNVSAMVRLKTNEPVKADFKERKQKGLGIPLGDGYVLALTHCVTVEEVDKFRSMGFFISLPIEIKDYKWSINGIDTKLIGSIGDLSVLYNPKLIDAYPLGFGDSDKVLPGEQVLSIGYTGNKVINLKDGIISSRETVYFDDNKMDGEADSSFMVSVPIESGDSGSPLLVYQDGELKIIGVVQAGTNLKGVGFAIMSNYIKSIINLIRWGY